LSVTYRMYQGRKRLQARKPINRLLKMLISEMSLSQNRVVRTGNKGTNVHVNALH
jgi:hypothetical protein